MTPMLDQLDAILEREYQSVVAGDFHKIPAIISDKSDLFSQVSQSDLSRPKIKAKLERNAQILRAAIDGLTASRILIEGRRHRAQSFCSYTADGQRMSFSAPESTFEKRK